MRLEAKIFPLPVKHSVRNRSPDCPLSLRVYGLAHLPTGCRRARILLCPRCMSHPEWRRASRHDVTWPARVRSVTESEWHAGKVVNLSVTGVLLQLERAYVIGERVEVEIEFLTQSESKTVVSGVGYVVRKHEKNPCSAAIHFEMGCRPAPRASAPAGRDARL